MSTTPHSRSLRYRRMAGIPYVTVTELVNRCSTRVHLPNPIIASRFGVQGVTA